MEDAKTSHVCCMCGDIGFSVELFRCNSCLYRYQHSYCSNYIKSSKVNEICDWCRSEQKSSPCSSTSSKASTARNVGNIIITSKPSEYSGDSPSPTKGHSASNQTRKNLIINGVPSPRTAARRYKLLKDVKC